MSPIHLILVRHGNTFEAGQIPTQVGARTDLPLTQEGRNQALSFARYLASQQIQPAFIYAGGLKRQGETAQIIANHLSLDKMELQEAALTEIDYGAWEGLTAGEIEKQWPDEYRGWTLQSTWPEIFGTTREAHKRAIENWFDQLTLIHRAGATVVGVTSNGILRLIYALQQADSIQEVKVKTGHFCELWLQNGGIQIQQWNQDPLRLSETNRLDCERNR
jgi:broad specificity phosphatase PhoE